MVALVQFLLRRQGMTRPAPSAADQQSATMPRTPAFDLESFVRGLDPATQATLLIELANEHPPVKQRLVRLHLANDPKRLAAGFKKTLTAWKRASSFLGYREAREFGIELEAWLGQVERELMPKNPAAAVDLAQAFIQCDAVFFNRADDSNGVVGDAVRAGCRLWLQAAARCESPPHEWPDRLDALAAGDEYGAREELYRRADLLLGEAALRALVGRHMARLATIVAEPCADGAARTAPVGTYKISATLSLLAQALRDPDVLVAAVRLHSPTPHATQMQGFAQAYIEYGRPADALPWLEPSWGHLNGTRERLRAQAFSQLGRHAESAAILKTVFEERLDVHDLKAWLAELPPAQQTAAITHARGLAVKHDDPVTAAMLLVEIGEHELAEAALLAAPQGIRGEDYAWLAPLAKALEAHQCWIGATAVYRALLDAILKRAYAPAYGHAYRHWQCLEVIAAKGTDWGPLQTHEAYVAEIRRQHARKLSFWAYVKGTRGEDPPPPAPQR